MNFKEFLNCELVKLCAKESNNSSAWKEFVRRFDDHIRLMLMRQSHLTSLRFKAIADDLANNVYLKLLENSCNALRTFRCENENAIYQFLAVTAQRVVHNDWRRENAAKRQHTKVFLNPTLLDILANPYAPSPDEKLMLESFMQEVNNILDEVITDHARERDKKIFLLHVYEGLTAQEISREVGLAPKSILNIIASIKKRLGMRRGGKK